MQRAALFGDDPRLAIASRWTPSLPALFARAFDDVEHLFRGFDRDGVLLVAVRDDGAIESYAHVPVDVEPTFATIGRYRQCDLVLGADSGASTRHVVLAARRVGLDEVRLRLWDLATATGIETEAGHRCTELATDGYLFVRLGRQTLFCLPTGAVAPLPWGPTAAETWSCIPERVLRACEVPARAAPAGSRTTSSALATCAPEVLRLRWCGIDGAGPPAGCLRVAAGGESIERAVANDELRRGLLIGREPRCAVGARLDRISRVHLLLVEEAGAAWAVDTASTNGTLRAGERVRQARLGPRAELSLGGALSLTWSAR